MSGRRRAASRPRTGAADPVARPRPTPGYGRGLGRPLGTRAADPVARPPARPRPPARGSARPTLHRPLRPAVSRPRPVHRPPGDATIAAMEIMGVTIRTIVDDNVAIR